MIFQLMREKQRITKEIHKQYDPPRLVKTATGIRLNQQENNKWQNKNTESCLDISFIIHQQDKDPDDLDLRQSVQLQKNKPKKKPKFDRPQTTIQGLKRNIQNPQKLDIHPKVMQPVLLIKSLSGNLKSGLTQKKFRRMRRT